MALRGQSDDDTAADRGARRSLSFGTAPQRRALLRERNLLTRRRISDRLLDQQERRPVRETDLMEIVRLLIIAGMIFFVGLIIVGIIASGVMA